MTTTQKIFSDLRKFFLQASKNPEKYRQRPEDFTRKRKLHFSKLALLQISLLKKVSKPNLTKSLPIPKLAPNPLFVRLVKN
jgi:hypothetical protein